MAVSRFNPDYPDAGLTLLNKTTFTGASSTSIDNVFSSDYDNYRILLNADNVTVSQQFLFRVRASGTDNSSSIYGGTGWYTNSSGGGQSGYPVATINSAFWDIGYMNSTAESGAIAVEIMNPFRSKMTFATSWQMRNNDTPPTLGTLEMRVCSYSHALVSSFDGFTIFRPLGTMTGSVSVYGYRKS